MSYPAENANARVTPPAMLSWAPIRMGGKARLDRPVLAPEVLEVLERVVERVLHRVHQERAEVRDGPAQRLVVPLPVDGVDDRREAVVPQQDEVRAHPRDLPGVLRERED